MMKMYSTDVRENIDKPKKVLTLFIPIRDSYISPRTGKTHRDKHETQCHGNRFINRAERIAWQKGEQAKVKGGKSTFPLHTCNGKKSQQLKAN